jgi:hypothetical protein
MTQKDFNLKPTGNSLDLTLIELLGINLTQTKYIQEMMLENFGKQLRGLHRLSF